MQVYKDLQLLTAISEAPVSAFPEKWMTESLVEKISVVFYNI